MDDALDRERGTLDPEGMIPVHTESDVTALWRDVRATLAVPGPQLSFVLVSARAVPAPQVTTIDQLPPEPRVDVVEQLGECIEASYRRLTPGGTVALLWSRPGRGPIRAGEAGWIREIGHILRRRHVPAWPAHFANDAFLRVVVSDDLAA